MATNHGLGGAGTKWVSFGSSIQLMHYLSILVHANLIIYLVQRAANRESVHRPHLKTTHVRARKLGTLSYHLLDGVKKVALRRNFPTSTYCKHTSLPRSSGHDQRGHITKYLCSDRSQFSARGIRTKSGNEIKTYISFDAHAVATNKSSHIAPA